MAAIINAKVWTWRSVLEEFLEQKTKDTEVELRESAMEASVERDYPIEVTLSFADFAPDICGVCGRKSDEAGYSKLLGSALLGKPICKLCHLIWYEHAITNIDDLKAESLNYETVADYFARK